MKLNYNHTLYACFVGYITQAIVNNLAPLLFVIFNEQLDIGLSHITLLVTVNFLTQLIVDAVSPAFADKVGYKKCIIAAHVFSSAGHVLMGTNPFIIPPFPALLISAMTYAVGGGIIEVLISPITEACPTQKKEAAMSLLHSFYCWGVMGVVIISTLFLQCFGKDRWAILCILWAIVPIFNAFYFSLVPVNRLIEDGKSMGKRQLFKNKYFLLFIVLMVSAGASEQAMSQWASFFAESALNLSKSAGDIFGICSFSLFMGISRLLYSKFEDKLPLKTALVSSGILCVFSYLMTALSPTPVLSLVFCSVTGFSVGILWPGVFSMAAKHFPKGGTAMFAYLALAGDLGCASGPTLTGFVSSVFGGNLNTGLIFATVFPVLLIVSAMMINTKKSAHF